MKHIKKSIIIFAAALFCMLPFFATSMTVQAEEPVTYFVKYVDANNEWRYQTGEWKEGGFHRELYYLQQFIKDGDLIVVDDGSHELKLEVNVRLSNVTIVNSPAAVITAKSFDKVYVLNNSTCAFNGDVEYAELYDAATVNFNNNVGFIDIKSERNDNLSANLSVVGTVDHIRASGKSYMHFEKYSFAANTLRVEKGILKTDKAYYSDTAPATTPAPSTNTNTASGTTSSEYDDVPKTGDIRFNPLWLVMIAGVCLAGAYRLKKN